jgi:hypothetical protein
MIHVQKCNVVLLSHSTPLNKQALCSHNHEKYFILTITVLARITDMHITVPFIETLF